MAQYNQTWGSVISCSMATSYSGSFEKLYICKSGIIDRIELENQKLVLEHKPHKQDLYLLQKELPD